METSPFRTSPHSSSNRGQCVEAASGNGTILVRDTTSREAGALEFSAAVWATFMVSFR